MPADTDHFRFEPSSELPTVAPDELSDAWLDIHGDKPRVLRNCQFAVDSIDGVFNDFYESWGRSSAGLALLNRKCDGQTILFERDGKQVYREPAPCTHQCDCKPTGRLRLFMPDLCKAVGVLGVVVLVTHATTDLDYIRNTLTLVRDQLGGLRNVAFVLHRVEEQLTTPDGFPVKKWVVHLDLETAGAQKVAQIAAQSALALPAVSTTARPETRPALPAPDVADDAPPVVEDSPDDAWEDDPTPPPAEEERLIGTANQLEIRTTGRGKSYHLRFQNGPSMVLQGFDSIRKISEWWHAFADAWKELEPETYKIPPLKVITGGGGLRFEADPQPAVKP